MSSGSGLHRGELSHYIENGVPRPYDTLPELSPVTRVEALELYLQAIGSTATAKECVIVGPEGLDDPTVQQLVQNILDYTIEG